MYEPRKIYDITTIGKLILVATTEDERDASLIAHLLATHDKTYKFAWTNNNGDIIDADVF